MKYRKNSRPAAWFLNAFALFLVFSGAAQSVFAQVDQGELEQNLPPVTFINFEGPHSRIETRAQIRAIGAGAGQIIQGGAARTGASNRYFVIHSVSAPDGVKLDADIFGLGVDTGVDHIRNLRLIIQGYLETAYGYSAQDAALLAEYITIYNAVYRGDWDYFTARYKTPVIENLSRSKTGLSIRFDEWPGNTLILIPLGIGGLSSIDTSAITGSRVVEELRKNDDMGVEQRKDMVDLKEREAAEAERKAAAEREAIKKEEQNAAQERARVEQEKENIAQEREQAKAEGDADKQAELDQRQEDADKKSDELDQREDELAQRKEDAQKLDDFAEKKTTEAQQERESIARDQQSAIRQDDSQSRGVIGVILSGPGAATGRLVRLDPATGSVLRRSPLDTVSVRTVTLAGGKIIAVAGQNSGGGAVRLIEINAGSLEMAKQGDDNIQPDTLIWVNGGDFYAITAEAGGALCLGRFNANLELQAKSKINVHPNASVLIQQGNLLTQRGDGSAAILDPSTLAENGK